MNLSPLGSNAPWCTCPGINKIPVNVSPLGWAPWEAPQEGIGGTWQRRDSSAIAGAGDRAWV